MKKLLISLLLLSLSACQANTDKTANTPVAPANNSYQVVNVVDGDTIDVKINNEVERIRLIGVDTPETVDPRKQVQCFGKEASKMTKDKLLNLKVTLEVDSSQGNTDKYGRLIRYVFLEDGTNFNKWLIENGYAFEYTYGTPYKYQGEFKRAQKLAMDSSAGLWAEGACNGQKTFPIAVYKYYLSKNAKTKYYCETDSAWKNITPTNLLIYDTEEKVKTDFPNLILNKPC